MIPAAEPRPTLPHAAQAARWAARLGAALLVTALVLLAYGSLPNRWYRTLYVYSGSMQPALRPGDLIIVTPPPAALRPGMILTLSVNGDLVTHRLVRVEADGRLVTQGDANPAPDQWENARVEVLGQVRARVPLLGSAVSAVRSVVSPLASGAWLTDKEEMDLSFSGRLITPTSAPLRAVLPTPAELQPTIIQLDGSAAAERTAGGAEVRGQLCVANLGKAPTDGLTLTAWVEDSGGQVLPGSKVSVPAGGELAPAEGRRCLAYTIAFDPGAGSRFTLRGLAQINNFETYTPGAANCPGPDVCPTGAITAVPLELPGAPAALPTSAPGLPPAPTATPLPPATATARPTAAPTVAPTVEPTAGPTAEPTAEPQPTLEPPMPTSAPPPAEPTAAPTSAPLPTDSPTQPPPAPADPTPEPTAAPTEPAAPADPTAPPAEPQPSPAP